MSWTPEPGQKVVCVSHFKLAGDEDEQFRAGVVLPRFQHVYTVRALRKVITYTGSTRALLLCEITNPVLNYLGGADPHELSFDVAGFRPLVSRQTDISTFKRILTNCDAREVA